MDLSDEAEKEALGSSKFFSFALLKWILQLECQLHHWRTKLKDKTDRGLTLFLNAVDHPWSPHCAHQKNQGFLREMHSQEKWSSLHPHSGWWGKKVRMSIDPTESLFSFFLSYTLAGVDVAMEALLFIWHAAEELFSLFEFELLQFISCIGRHLQAHYYWPTTEQ